MELKRNLRNDKFEVSASDEERIEILTAIKDFGDQISLSSAESESNPDYKIRIINDITKSREWGEDLVKYVRDALQLQLPETDIQSLAFRAILLSQVSQSLSGVSTEISLAQE